MSGVGKSTIREELQKRGFEAHDTDEDDITTWHNNKTGQPTHRPDAIEDRTKEWYEDHNWMMSLTKVQELAKLAMKKPIFLCGITSNDKDLWDLFDKAICLTVDEATLKHRLVTRTTNDFGKSPDELANILSWHKESEENYKKMGAIMLDATQPPFRIVNQIIDSTLT